MTEYRNRNLADIRSLLKDGDVLIDCRSPQSTPWTNIWKLPAVEFRGGNFTNCNRPAGVKGWDTVNRIQIVYKSSELIYDKSGDVIGETIPEPEILGVS